MSKETFYITTPIYYPNDSLHIGHSYTTVAADALARYHRRRGVDTWFLTGTDEHGQKIERAAREAGKSPQEFVDKIVAGTIKLWERLEISYDDFIRTTEPRHQRAVQEIFRRIYEQGDIYKSLYEGWYCVPCETFWIEGKLGEGHTCPDCGRPAEWTKEESYFFKLSKYAGRLLEHIEANPDFIQPPSRRNEMVNFIKQGLEDLCVSRTTFSWGIPVPVAENHVIYVWFDALSNYITALGYSSDDDGLYRRFWPADVQLVGKEIVRFHTIIWPIILMALGEPLPRQVFGHGWLLFGSGEKMSKSRGNVIDPHILIDRYGVDAVRYYLLREVPFGADGTYTEDALITRTNVDLANDLGNLVSRTTAMIEKFCHGGVPQPVAAADDGELQALAAEVLSDLEKAMGNLEISGALIGLWRLVDRANKYIDSEAPWALARDAAKADRLQTVLYNLAETLRIVGVALTPFLVATPGKIWDQLGLDPAGAQQVPWEEGKTWGGLQPGTQIRRGAPIFPRIEVEAEESADDQSAGQPAQPEARAAAPPAPERADAGLIDLTDFQKLDLRVAEVVAAEPVPKTDRLLKLTIRLAEGDRQIVSGIAADYRPADLIGKQIVVVANLKPAKLRGIESRGMLLAAHGEGSELALVTVDKPLPPGAKVK